MIIPVFRGVSRADALLQFVMDASSSMRVWDRMFVELQQIFGQLGAFRDVQVRYLHRGPDGSCAVSRSPDPAAAPLNSADRLSDPTGRRVTVLVSDCAGPLWHSGRAHRLLHQLARQAPTAVLQPLPQRMWNRTRLPVTYGALSRGEGLSGAAVLKVTEEVGGAPTIRPGALAVPVLPPVAGALGAWARLLSGTGAGRISGAVGWVRADQPAAPAPRPGDRLSSLQLISRFRSAASPVAGQLAVYLAAAPLHLPVMQLVQRTMLPDSGPSELAEVLLSGLLSRSRTDGPGSGQWYEFAPGVQEALLGPLGRDEALLVLKHCSEYIEQRFGKGGPNFPALAYAQLGEGRRASSYTADAGTRTHGGGFGENGESEEGDENGESGGSGSRVPHPFAEVAARVLERFMPLPEQFALYGDRRGRDATDRTTHTAVESARALLRHFDADSMVQYLIDAVQLLRGATEREEPPGADPELWAEYARCVLRLWEVQGGSELLREAEHAAELAAGRPGAVRERAVLAKVLHAAADDRRRRGDRRGALSLLRRADAEYTVACAAPGLDPAEALRLTLERVRAMEAQWRLSGDSSLLQGAVGMLEAFADVWPDQENRPVSLPLAHGRTLLHLARATADPEQSRLYAGQGARSLRKVLAGEGARRPRARRRGSCWTWWMHCWPRAPSPTRQRPWSSRRWQPFATSARAPCCRSERAGSARPGTSAPVTRMNSAARQSGSDGPPAVCRGTPGPTRICSPNGVRSCCAVPNCPTGGRTSARQYASCATAARRHPRTATARRSGCSCSAGPSCCGTGPPRTGSICGRPSICSGSRPGKHAIR